MPDFSKRSYEKELLDRTDIPFSDIKRNMQELEFINSNLGGHKITLNGIKKLSNKVNKKQISVCEIGCGGGDNLKAIARWCRKNNIHAQLTGIDINKDCIEYARENYVEPDEINFIISDYRLVKLDTNKPDIIFSSLFTHHLDDQQFEEMLQWCNQNAGYGFFINDLHRHFLAYYSIKFLTQLFSKSYLVKNDAPLSVRRGFRKSEIRKLLRAGRIEHFDIEWKWAFRWLITVQK